MKKIIIVLMLMLICTITVQAQSNTVSIGGQASGSGGSASFSAGEVFYEFKTTTTTSISEGVQQSYSQNPTAIISGNAIICAGSSTQLSISLTGQGPWRGTLSDGTTFSGSVNPILVTVTPVLTTTYSVTSLSSENLSSLPEDLSGSALVTITPITVNSISIIACDSYTWNGNIYNSSGTYSYKENCVEHILNLTINSNAIKSQPENASICKVIGGITTLSVESSAINATYKWYTQPLATATTGAWTVVENNANYSGATNATLIIKKTALTIPATGSKYKVVITNSCGISTSNIVSITDFTVLSKVAVISVLGTLSPLLTTCQGNSVNLSLAAGSIGNIQWQSSIDGINYNNVGDVRAQSALSATNSVMTFNTGDLSQTTWFRVIASNGACSSVASAAVRISVSTPVNTGTISGGNVTVCAPLEAGFDASGNVLTTPITNSTILTLSDYSVGATILWQKSTNYTTATPTWAAAGSTTNTLTASALTADTWFRALVTNGACKDFTLPVKITVSKSAKAGVTTSAASVCSGGDITFTSAAYTGTSIKWQVSTTSTTTGFSDISGATTASYNMTGVTYTPLSKFYVRSVVTSGSCTSAFSAVKTITVNPLSVAGTVKGGGTICSGANGTLSVAGNTGTIQWQSSANGTDFVNVTGTATTYTASNITEATYFRAKITSGACSVAYSNAVQFTIETTATSGTLASANETVCSGTGTTLTLTGSVGAIKWYKSTNWTIASPTWTAVTTSSTGTLATGNLTASTAYKADVTIGSCSKVSSQVVPVMVYTAPLAKTITANVTYPSGATSALAICSTSSISKILTIGAGYNGGIQWQKSTTSTTTGFADITDATGTRYTVTNPAIGVNYFRAKFTNSCGVSVFGAAFTVYYKECASTKGIETTVTGITPFSVITYPNPFSNNFNINVTSTSSENVEVRVYDMIGKLIYKNEMPLKAVSELQIGANYPTGTYNVIVSQGKNVKTLRVIKQ
jgi:hypothetical protein